MRDTVSTPEPSADHRARLRELVESMRFRYPVLVLIGINAVALGLETAPSITAEIGALLAWLDSAIRRWMLSSCAAPTTWALPAPRRH